MQIINSDAVDYASLEVINLNYDTTSVLLETNVTCIYDKTGEDDSSEPQQMAVLLVIYQDNILKACKISEVKTLSSKAAANITVEIPAQDISDYNETADYKAEIYLIDNETNEKPLTKMQIVE